MTRRLRKYRKIAHFNVTHRRRQNFYALPSSEWKHLSAPPFNFLSTLDHVDDAIDANADIAVAILETGLQSFGLEKEPSDGTADWHDVATSADLDKARSTIRQFYRDWSVEGACERQASYEPVLRDLADTFAGVSDRGGISILVPGAGLGRLVFELCQQGFYVEGNEVSYHQLIASNWILNHTKKGEQHALYPFALDFSNIVSRTHQLKLFRVPDIHPATALNEPNILTGSCAANRMNMTAGDFTELYNHISHREQFDAVVTVFFLDTAPNPIEYIRTIRHCLKPGGIWVNNGPLLWHWAERGPLLSKNSAERSDDHVAMGTSNQGHIELTVEEILLLVMSMGFEVDDKGVKQEKCGYIQNPDSLLQNLYRTSHWTARKVA